MKLKTKLLFQAVFFVLALPLMFAGIASARYMGDGAVPDGAGGWKTPSDGICVVGLHQDGTMDVADGITSQRDCIYLTTGTMNVGTSFDLRGMTTSAACATAGATGNDGAKHAWSTSGCWASDGTGISLNGLDRTLPMCTAKGGTWVTTGKCAPYGWQYRGQNASGTPLAIGTKGVDASANAGFCYTSMRTGIAAGSCPSTSTNSSTAFGYSVSSTYCVYAYGINGPVSAILTKADGTPYVTPAGTTVDLSTLTTQGDCLANGASWTNWMPLNATATIGTITTAATFDLTRQAPSADDGCLHCHSYNAQANGPAERFKDSYLKTGHANMLRKVTAGIPWAGPDGVVYATDGTNTFDWVNGKIIVGGTSKDLYYIYGDWMIANPTAVYNGGGAYTCAGCHTAGYSDTNPGVQSIGTPLYVGVQPGAHAGVSITGNWDLDGIGCGRCHNATVPTVTATQIAASTFPTTAPTGGGMGALAAGVGRSNLCFGCHQSNAKKWPAQGGSSGGDLQYDPTWIAAGVSHGAQAGRDFNGHVIGNSFFNSVHARYAGAQSGIGSITLNSLGKYDLTDATGTSVAAEYGSIFKGYACFQSTSSASPAKTKNASGDEITNKTDCETLYGAGAWRSDTGVSTAGQSGYQGTCTTCHDVHNSMYVAGQEEAAIRKTCENCHVNNSTTGATDVSAPQVVVAHINHPPGPGTPFDTAKYESACVVCHMATQAVENGNQVSAAAHLWRVNTSASYNTFPTTGQFYGGTCSVHTGAVKNAPYLPVVYLSDTSSINCTTASGTWTAVTKDCNAQTAADGTYAKAVWVDLDLACGQCHGGSLGLGNTHFNAPYYAKAQLSPLAANMHNTNVIPPPNVKPVAGFSLAWGTGVTSWQVTLTDSSTDTAPLPSGAVRINWGDGSPLTTGNQSGTFIHTYRNSGTYTITEKIVDASGLSDTKKQTGVQVVKYSISGAVTQSNGITLVSGAMITVTGPSGTKTVSSNTSGSYSITNLKPGAYTMTISRSGYTFPALSGATIGPNATVNISSTSP